MDNFEILDYNTFSDTYYELGKILKLNYKLDQDINNEYNNNIIRVYVCFYVWLLAINFFNYYINIYPKLNCNNYNNNLVYNIDDID